MIHDSNCNQYGTRSLPRVLTALLVALVLATPQVFAQDDEPATGANEVSMRPGTIDAGLSGGLGAFVYPFLEPQIDIGLIPLGPVTLSAGAVGDVGYCLLCNLLRVVDSDWRLNSYYFGVYGRVLAHLTFLTDSLGDSIRIDPYAGLSVGPRLYAIALEYRPEDVSSTATVTSFIISPQVGARVFFDEEVRWFAFGEARYLLEFGFQSQTVEVGEQTYAVTDEEFSGGGTSVNLGIGLRL